jgi:S-adenosylmethionine hydrolase
MFSSAQVITLMSDFGLTDPYVGQMKGAILSRNPKVRLVDLCHGLPRQDVLAAALALHSSYAAFPPGTIHLTVVDPGVGSQRHILVAASEQQLFLAPDNGILSLLLQEGQIKKIHRLTNPHLRVHCVSSTFHGRDIMAPAAAALADGFPLEEVGPEQKSKDCVCLSLPRPVCTPEGLEGVLLHSDHFGNMRSSLRQEDLARLAPAESFIVELRGQNLPLLRTYTDAPLGSLLALIDSAGFIEIAVNRGSALDLLACMRGEKVRVQPVPSLGQGTGRQ